MEAPLPATPKDYEDNLQKSLNNEEKNNNNINEGNNNPINDDKNKVDALRKSLSQDIDGLRKTCPALLNQAYTTCQAMITVWKLCHDIVPTISKTKNNIGNQVQPNTEKIKETIIQTYKEKSGPLLKKYSAKCLELEREIKEIDILPKACIKSFFSETNSQISSLSQLSDNINNSYKELMTKCLNRYDKQTQQTNIPLSVNYEELKDIKKKILKIQSNMNDLSKNMNNLIQNHFIKHCKTITDEITRIEQFNSKYQEIMQIDMTVIKPQLTNIVDYIRKNIHCVDFYYPDLN